MGLCARRTLPFSGPERPARASRPRLIPILGWTYTAARPLRWAQAESPPMQGDSPRVAHCAHVDTDSADVAAPRYSSPTGDGSCVPMQYIGLRALPTPYSYALPPCSHFDYRISIIGQRRWSKRRRGRFAPSPRPYQRGVGTASGYGQATSVERRTYT